MKFEKIDANSGTEIREIVILKEDLLSDKEDLENRKQTIQNDIDEIDGKLAQLK